MKKCPFCAEEIQDEAIKCRHCGEMLKKEVKAKKTKIVNNICPKCSKIYDNTWKNCINCNVPLVNKEMEVKDDGSIRKNLPIGKFSCPRCGSKHTKCERAIGCLVTIIIFVSLGLGLIMIPFLPYHCECLKCKHKWKT